MKKITTKAVQIVAPPPISRPDKAFTLAEVLIALAIIGIVAAMTIPTLVNNYQEKQTVSRLTKAYGMISNAYQMAKIDNGELSSWGFTNNSQSPDYANNAFIFWEKITPYLKINKEKAVQNANKFEYKRYYLSGEVNNNNVSVLIHLADGMTLSGGWISNFACNDKTLCGDFFIDINGMTNSPNTIGKDIFYFYIYKDAIIPIGTKDDTSYRIERGCNLNSTIVNNGYGCTAWVIYNKNMDYLKCSDLSWDGKHKCD